MGSFILSSIREYFLESHTIKSATVEPNGTCNPPATDTLPSPLNCKGCWRPLFHEHTPTSTQTQGVVIFSHCTGPGGDSLAIHQTTLAVMILRFGQWTRVLPRTFWSILLGSIDQWDSPSDNLWTCKMKVLWNSPLESPLLILLTLQCLFLLPPLSPDLCLASLPPRPPLGITWYRHCCWEQCLLDCWPSSAWCRSVFDWGSVCFRLLVAHVPLNWGTTGERRGPVSSSIQCSVLRELWAQVLCVRVVWDGLGLWVRLIRSDCGQPGISSTYLVYMRLRGQWVIRWRWPMCSACVFLWISLGLPSGIYLWITHSMD